MSAALILADCTSRGIRLRLDGDRLRYSAPPGVLTDADLACLRANKPALLALLAGAESPPATPADPGPAGHCPACGSPSFWRSPVSPAWACSYCEPRPPAPLPEGFEALALFSGQWAPGTAAPAAIPTTVADLLALHGEIVAGCRTLDVLAEADDTDLPELRSADVIAGFARALVADGRVRPLPPASLPPLARLAAEIGDDVAELRRWLDLSAQGQRIRARIEREPGACDRVLLAVRADRCTGLHELLLRALDGDQDRARRPDDGRVQDERGAWFTVGQRRALAALDAHHWRCETCRRAGRGYGDRCPTGAELHAACRAAVRGEPEP